MFGALFLFLYGVLGSVFACLACASMLVSVTFYVGMREVWMMQEPTAWMLWEGLREKKFHEKKGIIA